MKRTHSANLLAIAIAILACGIVPRALGQDPDAGLAPNTAALTSDDVRAIVTNAAAAVNDSGMVIAVSDRQGNILAMFRKNQAPASSIGNFGNTVDTNELAAAVARTAAFFSNSQAPLSSRTVRFISGIHFLAPLHRTQRSSVIRRSPAGPLRRRASGYLGRRCFCKKDD
jgi:hypothetical protein